MPAESATETVGNYEIRPSFQNKFRVLAVKQLLQDTLKEKLQGRLYNVEEVVELTKELTDMIKHRLKELNYNRYKFVVQVVLGEQKGQGSRMASRCFWDSDTDSVAYHMFANDSIFCLAAAFGVYHY